MKLFLIVTVLAIIILRELVALVVFDWSRDDNESVTLSERLDNLNEKWFHWGERGVEHVTVGWRKSEDQQERTNSHGIKEYYTVVRKGKR